VLPNHLRVTGTMPDASLLPVVAYDERPAPKTVVKHKNVGRSLLPIRLYSLEVDPFGWGECGWYLLPWSSRGQLYLYR